MDLQFRPMFSSGGPQWFFCGLWIGEKLLTIFYLIDLKDKNIIVNIYKLLVNMICSKPLLLCCLMHFSLNSLKSWSFMLVKYNFNRGKISNICKGIGPKLNKWTVKIQKIIGNKCLDFGCFKRKQIHDCSQVKKTGVMPLFTFFLLGCISAR